MNWVQINERIFELEKKTELTNEEIKEWNKLVTSKVAGIVKRNEKSIRETKAEKRGEKKDEGSNALDVHGRVAQEKALL